MFLCYQIIHLLGLFNMHVCFFVICEKCDLDNVSKMPSVITIYGADNELKYSQVIQSSLTQCYSRFTP